MSDAADLIEITQLILRERQGRDRGWWQQMRDAFSPDSVVRLSWYRGDGLGFVDGSERMSGRGDRAVHRLSPPVIHINADRAIAEMSCGVEFQIRPGDRIDVDSAAINGYRPSYALLTHYLRSKGYDIADDLLGDDRREPVEEFYDELMHWLQAF